MNTEVSAIRVAARVDRLLTAEGLGVSPASLVREATDGALERVVPGVYIGPLQRRSVLTEGAAWTLRHPKVVVGLLTAALYYGLTNAFARGTWLLVPKGASPPRSETVPVHVVQVSPALVEPARDEENGILTVEVHGVKVRVTGPDRTVIDLWRYPRRVSSEFALEALGRRVRAEDFHLPAFARLARPMGAWDKLEPVVQGILLR